MFCFYFNSERVTDCVSLMAKSLDCTGSSSFDICFWPVQKIFDAYISSMQFKMHTYVCVSANARMMLEYLAKAKKKVQLSNSIGLEAFQAIEF